MAPVKATLKEEKSSDKKQDNHYTNDDAYKATTDPATDEVQDNTDSTASTNPGPRQITMNRMSAPISTRTRARLSSQTSKANPRQRLAGVVAQYPFQKDEEATDGAMSDEVQEASDEVATDKAQEATDSATSTNTSPRQITMLRMSAPTSARARAILSSQPSKPNPRKRLAAIVAHSFQNTEEPTNGAGNDDTQGASDDVAVNETQDNINPSTSTSPGIRQITILRMSAPTSARAQAILSSQPSKPNPRKRLAAVVSHPFQLSGSAKTGREPTLKRKKSSGDEDDKKEEATDEDFEPSSSNDGSARKKKKVE